MSTTVTIDDDVAALLEQETRRTGVPVSDTVNRLLRSTLESTPPLPAPKPFVMRTRHLGLPKEWTSGSVEELIEMFEGPLHR